ncbi:hypothetical protein Pfo_023337 [Paulownia fortunei]|nr:hypothetical protein Pfo_023337 [Paulownia fortunei]
MSLSKRIPLFLLRLLALGATVSATVIMVTSHDSAQVFNMNFKAKYTNSPTFNSLIIHLKGYLQVLCVDECNCKWLHPYTTLFPFKEFIWALDLGLGFGIISACLAIGQVAKNGNSHAGWLPICGQVPKFCDHVRGAMIAGFVAAILYFLILLYSLHNVMNLFALKT